MKVYYVYVDNYDYDEYDAIVVVAENKDKALELTKTGRWSGRSFFEEHQGEIHVEEVDMTEEGIIFAGYNAG